MGNTFNGTNIIGSFNLEPEKPIRILLAAHWDTRPTADKDPDPIKRHLPILGANDGASGVAILMEIAKLLSEYKSEVEADIVLFDLEDMGEKDSESDSNKIPFCIGSEYFAKTLNNYKPKFGILLDIVGDKHLRIPVIDLIQTPFPDYWHTMEDIPDKCSPESLKNIGDVIIEVILNE